jgi:hypothetical protein
MQPEERGRWALVTGESAGIGRAFAQVLAEEGFSLVLTARREERLEALARDLQRDQGVDARVLAADLGDPSAPPRLREALHSQGISIDVLVNNAGFGSRGAFDERPWYEHAAMIQVLVTAVAHLTHLLLPDMVERRWGRILNVASLAGLLPGAPKRTLYGAAKAFVIKFSEALSLEHLGDGVHVTAVCPGFTYSEFHDVVGTRGKVAKLPDFLWMDAMTVARQGYAAAERGDPVYVNGLANRAVSLLGKLAPRRAALAMIRRQALRLSADSR